MPARIFLRRLAHQFIKDNPFLQAEVESALEEISVYPHVDAETKFYYPVPPGVISLYKKDNLWVLCRLNDAHDQIDVWNIGKLGDKVAF